MQDFIYRIGTTDDIEKIVKLGISSFGQFKDQLSNISWKKLETYLLNEIPIRIYWINQNVLLVRMRMKLLVWPLEI